MSGNRANAAAIQRRTAGAQNNVAPPGGSRPPQQQQQQQMRPQQQQQQLRPQQQQPIRPQAPPPQPQVVQQPKMSVSDAIGLITLRLGRVETFIQKLPPLDQIGANYSGEMGEIGENMRVVDEAVFTNIVARLEKVEQTPKAPASAASSKATNQAVDELKKSVEALNNEMVNIKSLLMSLQSFTMQTNQKLTDLIFNQQQNDGQNEDEQQEQEYDEEYEEGEEGEEGEVGEEDADVESAEIVNDDSEILAESIDLKAFVQSAI